MAGRHALKVAAKNQAPSIAAWILDEARLATLDALGDAAAASAIAAWRLRASPEAAS